MAMSQNELYIGLMSGTSTDGVDAVLARFNDQHLPVIIDAASCELPAELRQQLLDLNQPGSNELERSNLAAIALTHCYADVCQRLLQQQQLPSSAIRAIGAHGQTIRHRPELGFTIQLNAPALLAELTNIAVIADFRSRDIAAGGQGAPLVPSVHQGLFACDHPRVILNLGGIANISILHPSEALRGFDTGPASMLMDYWIGKHQGVAYDASGTWASSGKLLPALLTAMLAEPWLQLAPPKSTGRDLFNANWLETLVQQHAPHAAPADVQATLLELTARSVSDAIQRYAAGTKEVLVCGGGAFNSALLQRIAQLSDATVRSTDALGLHPQHVEALAFAWLAHAHIHGIKANAPAVTGARHSVMLGAYYPA